MSEGKKNGGLALHWQIAVALVLAVAAGLFLPAQIGTFRPAEFFDFFGKLFLRALQMLVVPLIVTAVVSAVAKLGEEEAFGRLGLKTIGYYLATTALAVVIGLTVMNVLRPGVVPPEVSKGMIAAASRDAQTVAEKLEGRGAGDVVGIFQRMIPVNVVQAASQNGEMLAVIFFSVMFGYFVTRLPQERREGYARWWDDGYEVMIRMTDFVIRFTPYGVFALVAATVAQTGLAAFAPLARFFLCVLLGLGLHMFVALPLLMKLFGLPPSRHFRAMAPALLTAFSTASSAASLPFSLDCMQKNAGVSRRVSSFTLPLGATVNMDGTALYECAVVIFVAQIYGVDLSLGSQITVVMLALLTSIGVAGIPAASLVAIVIILGAVGLPKEAIGMVLAVDRLLDMCRTTVNVFGDSCGAAIIARTEGERIYEAGKRD